MDFNQVMQMNLGSYTRAVPLTNSFGRVYPVLHDELLAQLLEIQPGDRVLDIGGGSNPFKRADVVTEPFPTHNAHRSGHAPPPGFDYVECFAEELPFRDKEFDFALSRQVFEHVNDPGAACREIMRVARRGFIETPQGRYDLLMGPNPTHQWFVSMHEHTLVFERRRFIRHPFRHVGLSQLPSSPEGQFLLHWELKNVTNVQFYWEGQFQYHVVDYEDGFRLENPDHAAEAHLDSALCSLLWDSPFLEQRENDAREALRYRPRWALAHNTLGVILWRQQKREEAVASFRQAAELEPSRREFRHNAGLASGADTGPLVADFDDVLPLDEAYFRSYAGRTGIHLHKLLSR